MCLVVIPPLVYRRLLLLCLPQYREWQLNGVALEVTEQRWEDHSFAPVDASELKKFYGRSLNLAEVAF
jgi:hypothetical protein